MSAFMVFLAALVKRILQGVAQNLWDRMWGEVFNFAVEAEVRWKEKGKGAEKKEWLLDQTLEFIETRANLSWTQKQLIRLFVGEIVDSIIDELNERIGKDWGDKIEDLRDELAGRIPFIT